jgi:hypothetical protein
MVKAGLFPCEACTSKNNTIDFNYQAESSFDSAFFIGCPLCHLRIILGKMKNRMILIVIAGLALLYWAVLVFRLPIFNVVPDYFWHFMQYDDQPPGSFWLLGQLLLVAVCGLWLVLKYHGRKGIVIAVLILLGYLLHLGIGFLDGRGIDGFRVRLLTFGHSEFVKLACAGPSISAITNDYETILANNPDLRYTATKPPGQLLFYVLSQTITEAISPSETYHDRMLKLSLFISLVWPLFAFLVIWPMYSIAKRLYDHETAVMAGVLYLFIPSVMLVILHLDQVLFPLLFMLTIGTALRAGREASYVMAVASGTLVYLSLYMSFSLAVVWPVSIAMIILHGQGRFRWKGAALSVLGTLLMYGLFHALFHYDALTRYANAMMYHRAWKLWQPGLSETMKFGLLNLIEFACWLGLPPAVWFLASVGGAMEKGDRQKSGNAAWFPVIIALAVGGMAFLGQTKGEVARLWIFIIPLICLAVAFEIRRRFPYQYNGAVLYTIGLQYITVILMKYIQDFW